ncbi:PstS family phosphate ABC transporter substrate-binding protein [Sediminibacterium soli]|uniref:PstS family phosphate ABC transporter substrate-binding protein n=1 Tax=Sediminibacterium soli TaxID=2698829 RepID=UPI00137ABBB6|nr:substrate-binding domain-containing protein [Sediminibacterium soli]NCI47465.1 phosphate ABC transporter substrate-binding protein, PhoT family [Sediminibacterium soli]
MKKRYLLTVVSGLVAMFFVSCGDSSQKGEAPDTPQKGTIRISVDESFKPVIEEQLQVYHSSFPNTNIIASYKSEAACFRDLQSDSTRMIIVAKGLTEKEEDAYKARLEFKPVYGVLAFDAIAVVVNRDAKDSVFTIAALKDILSGRHKLTAVMDGRNATSTVRYLQDSLLKGASFGANVVAAENSEKVIDIVSGNPDVIGFVGMSWVGDLYDPKQLAYRNKIRLALVQCISCEDKEEFAKPSQSTITYGQYPLARPLFYILKENTNRLGTGFMNFMSLERGQLIFRRAFLAPAKMGFMSRKGNIKNAD